MAPNVDTFIMHHEQTFENFLWIIKVDPVTMSYVIVVDHIGWSSSDATNE